MKPLSSDDLARWRAEIDLGVEFRDKEFGTYRAEVPGKEAQTTLAGMNLDLFEQGARSDEALQAPLNLVFPIVKIIVPTLFYQQPRVTALPDSRDPDAAEDAFYASELLNRDLRDVDFRFKETSQQAVFDSFLLGFGVVKIGYATEFGADILPTKQEDRQKFRERVKRQVDSLMQAVGLKPPTEPKVELEAVQADLTIRSEQPYLTWVSPFDFVIDPRARDLTDARWVAQRIRSTIADIKRDRRYGRAKFELDADAVDDDRLQASFIEEFQTVDKWEVHVKDPDSKTGISVFTLACTQLQTKPLMQPIDQAYDLGGWQYEWLTPNKHGHRLYPISTVSILRPMLDRINSSLDAILEQVDKFQAKVAYNERVTPEGEMALDSPTMGARIKIEGREDVRSALAVVSMEQVAQDMVQFVNQLVDLVLVLVGVTRAQFTGISTAQTATEAQIGQGGQNLRRTDEGNTVGAWTNRVVTKLWRVKSQFQDFTQIDLVQEGNLLNPQTGITQTQWYPPIDQPRADRLKRTRFRLALEVSSIQKPSLDVIRSQFEQFARAMMEPAVTQGLALEGRRLSASEIIRQWIRFFSEYGLSDLGKVVVPVQDAQMKEALLNYGQTPTTTPTQRASNGRSLAGSVPNVADLISATAGEKGQGVPIA